MRNQKHESIYETLTQKFGDLETFQIESKTGLGMIPTSFSTTVQSWLVKAYIDHF